MILSISATMESAPTNLLPSLVDVAAEVPPKEALIGASPRLSSCNYNQWCRCLLHRPPWCRNWWREWVPFSMILWMEDRRLRGRIMDAREPETLAVVALGIGHGGSSNGTRLVMMSMLLISRPFPNKFSKPKKKSSSTRFFCSKKKNFVGPSVIIKVDFLGCS